MKSSIQAAESLVRYALSEANATGLLSTATRDAKVYGVRISGGKNMLPCVLVRAVSGAASESDLNEIRRTMIDIRFFGGSINEAYELYESFRFPWGNKEGLHGATGFDYGGIHFYSALEKLPGQDLPDQVTANEVWDCVYTTWQIDWQPIE